MNNITTEQITEAVKIALAADRKAFYIPPEEHYNHHQFIEKAIAFFDKTTGTVTQTIIRAVVLGVIIVLGAGVIALLGKRILASMTNLGG